MAEFARGQVCRGDFIRGRVCQGPSLLGAEMSSIRERKFCLRKEGFDIDLIVNTYSNS